MEPTLTKDAEKVLQALLKLPRKDNNIVSLCLNGWNVIEGFEPSRILQCLFELEPQYISLKFHGRKEPNNYCDITLKASALEYKEIKRKRRAITRHDYLVASVSSLVGAIVGFILGAIVAG